MNLSETTDEGCVIMLVIHRVAAPCSDSPGGSTMQAVTHQVAAPCSDLPGGSTTQ